MRRTLQLSIALALLCGLAAFAGARKPPALADIIFDRAGFIARLPRKTLTFPLFSQGWPGTKDARMDFEAALYALGEVKGVDFVELDREFVRPSFVSGPSPQYPTADVSLEESGHADFLVLIGRTGGVSALYCTDANERLFAISGANALVQWRFNTATYSGQPLPVLVMVRMNFVMNINGVDHKR